jgi:hypothetical protein
VLKTSDFENMHWHDNAIHAIRLLENYSCGDLVLDIDYIAEWLAPLNNVYSFKVASADLMFHNVSNLIISVNYATPNAAVQPMIIREIHREAVTFPNGYFTFAWNIELNWPSGFITFNSSEFTQSLRMEPIIYDAQYLPLSERK